MSFRSFSPTFPAVQKYEQLDLYQCTPELALRKESQRLTVIMKVGDSVLFIDQDSSPSYSKGEDYAREHYVKAPPYLKFVCSFEVEGTV